MQTKEFSHPKIKLKLELNAQHKALYTSTCWWQLDLSLHKCLILHIGNNGNVYQSYNVDGMQLLFKNETVDLGIIMDSKLRFDKHILSMVNKAHAKAALIRRCFRSKDRNLLFRAFTVYCKAYARVLFASLESSLPL